MAIRRLRTQLFLWFLAAIVLATVSSTITVAVMRPEAPRLPSGHVARTISTRLEAIWDDAPACEAYVAEMREVSGHALSLRRDPKILPPARRTGPGLARRPYGFISFDEEGHGFIPVVRNGVPVGAVEFPTGLSRSRWWRLFAGLLTAAIVMAFAAERVARGLARPLERIAGAADKFGGGDLAARTGLVSAKTSADEVRQVAVAFDAMAERVERTLRDQRELLAAISHELRSPLGRARVALEIGRERATEDSAKRPLDHVEQQLVEVDAILSDLLAVTRAGLTDLRAEPRRYAAWLRTRIAAEQSLGEVELLVDEDVESVELAIDAPLLGRALHNLLANARVHGHPADEPLEVRVASIASAQGKRICTSVHDRGRGIAEDILPRIFDPFVRGDETRPHGAGTGLGLSLVRRIVEAHKGTVFARNGEVGAEVGFELPVR
jgi:two-component system OmpR family sensor kinase